MKTKTMMVALATLLIGGLCFWACQKDFDMPGMDSESAPVDQAFGELPEGTAEGYLVGFKNIPDHALIQGAGGRVIHTFNNFPVMHIQLPEQALEGLRRAPGIDFIERNYSWSIFRDYADYCPGDHLVCAEGQINTFHISRIGGQSAWFSGATGKGIRLAVLDTGIDGDHKDLQPNLASDGFTVIRTGAPTRRHWLFDPNGHGTHVAGTAGAGGVLHGSFNALLGVAPEVSLVSVRVLQGNGSGSWADIAAGIDWCIDQNNNIDIINMSLGDNQSSSTLELAVQNAWDAGLLIVSSAGNSGNEAGDADEYRYPAAYDQVIAVAAASNQVDSRASFSTTGPYVELIAPGQHVFSTHINDYGYHYMNGTSMAAPHVAGVAALVWAANPSLSNQQVRNLLSDHAECLNIPFNHQGHGLVRADKVLGVETGRIQGFVFADDQPVYAATLTLSDGSNIFTTHSSASVGYTMIVPPGNYTATAFFNYGYDPVSAEVTVAANEVTDLDLSLTGEIVVPDPLYTVAGTVEDAEDGTALHGATVLIDETGYSAITGSDGNYIITDVKEGSYSITASLPGYVSKTKKEVAVTGDTTVGFSLSKEEDSGDPDDPDPVPEPGELSIDDFQLTNTSNPQWARVLVNWEVSGVDLTGVSLNIDGPNEDSESWNISGNSASGEYEFSFRRGFGTYYVTLTVTDKSGSEPLSKTKEIEL